MLTQSLQCILIGTLTTIKIALQQSVHHHIWIATNWRSEVGVVWKCKAVMADICCSIYRLCHRTDSKQTDNILLCLAANVGHQLIKLLCHCKALLRLKEVAKAENKCAETLKLLAIWLVVYTEDHCSWLAVSLCAECRHTAVGKEHKLLDKLICLLLHLEVYTRRLARLVKVELSLTAVKGNSTLAVSLLAHTLR